MVNISGIIEMMKFCGFTGMSVHGERLFVMKGVFTT